MGVEGELELVMWVLRIAWMRFLVETKDEGGSTTSLAPRPDSRRRKGPGFHCLRMHLIICN